MDNRLLFDRAKEILSKKNSIDSPIVNKPGVNGIDDVKQFMLIIPKLVPNKLFPHLKSIRSEVDFCSTKEQVEKWIGAFGTYHVDGALMASIEVYDLESSKYQNNIEWKCIIQIEGDN